MIYSVFGIRGTGTAGRKPTHKYSHEQTSRRKARTPLPVNLCRAERGLRAEPRLRISRQTSSTGINICSAGGSGFRIIYCHVQQITEQRRGGGKTANANSVYEIKCRRGLTETPELRGNRHLRGLMRRVAAERQSSTRGGGGGFQCFSIQGEIKDFPLR